MPYINDAVLDNGLAVLTANLDRVDICSVEPTTYTEATSTFSLGNAAVTTGAAQNGAVDGRRVVVGAISGGPVMGTGTASHYGCTDGLSVLYVTEALAASQVVTSGNTFNLAAFDVTLRDAA